jgi:glycosyltransferase involved in cell wall biosynthesis
MDTRIIDRKVVPSCVDFSIVAIIPLYNGARWIEESIGSVLAQTVSPDEFIVVDDGSTDDGPGIVEQLARRYPIKLLRKSNGGQSSARNFGVKHSDSALVAFLDQDDFWYRAHLERLVREFQKHCGNPRLGWVYSDLDEIDEGGGLVHRNFLRVVPLIVGKPLQNPKTTLAGCLSQDMFVLPSASLISREAFEAIGGFDEALCGYEDDDLFLRIFRKGYDNVFLDEALSCWRTYPSSTSHTERMDWSRMIYARKLIQSFPDDRRLGRYWVRDCIVPRFLNTVVAEYVKVVHDRKPARKRQALADLGTLIPYLPMKKRALLRVATPFLGLYAVAYIALILVNHYRRLRRRPERAASC